MCFTQEFVNDKLERRFRLGCETKKVSEFEFKISGTTNFVGHSCINKIGEKNKNQTACPLLLPEVDSTDGFKGGSPWS